MPDIGHESPEHRRTHPVPEPLPTPDAATVAPGARAGRTQAAGRADAGAVAPLFSHFAEGAGATAAPVQRKEKLPQGEEGFAKMWDAHPHNYQADESQNQSSADLLEEQGLPDWIGNTCAVRLSTMLNNMGYTITPEKTKAAGMSRAPTYSKKTKQYYILAASEMWNYISKNFRKADQTFPPAGIYKDAESFQAAYDKEIRPIIAERKGVVAFETIFGYSGTGHVDIFSGETLSDAPNWYPCKRLHLWYSVTP
jgi:hypothetical protein